MAVNQFEIGKRNAGKTQSIVRDKNDKIAKPVTVASALVPSMPGFDGTLGPRGLDTNRDAWAEALSNMSGVYTPDPLSAVAKVAGMGLAGYGQGKASRAKDEGTASYKAKLAEALSGSPDNTALMGLMGDQFADEGSQRMLWNIYERNNPTQDEMQQRQLRDLQMQQTQQGMTAQQQQMEAARVQQEQQAQLWQQQQEEIQRQKAIRGGKMDAVEGFMQGQQAMGGDLFDPAMQAQLRAQGVAGADPQDTRRYDAMQPYAQAGDYENAFTQMTATPEPAESKPQIVPKGSSIYQDGQWITPPAGEQGQQQAIEDPMKITDNMAQSKNYQAFNESSGMLNSMFKSLSDRSSISDLDFVLGLAKIMDPTSVVRTAEGEQVQATQSMPSYVAGQINKVLQGKATLDDKTRMDMYRLAQRRVDEFGSRATADRDFYSKMAEANGFDPSLYVQPLPQGPSGRLLADPQNYPRQPAPAGAQSQQPPGAPVPHLKQKYGLE